MMGLRVVSANQIEWTDIRMTELKLTGCRYATWKNAFVRSFMKNISSLLMIPGHMTPLFNKMRRAIYDSVAGTGFQYKLYCIIEIYLSIDRLENHKKAPLWLPE